jgi:hypothetical protein
LYKENALWLGHAGRGALAFLELLSLFWTANARAVLAAV